jgi:hypothetical protein
MQAVMGPTIANFVMLISGRPSVNEASRNVIDLGTDTTAMAQNDGVRRPARLSETCCHLLVVTGFLYPNRVQKNGLRNSNIMHPSCEAEMSCIHRLTALASFTGCFLHNIRF